MKVLKISDFKDVSFLKKHYKNKFSEINQLRIVFSEENNEFMFCIKDVFDVSDYMKNYYYKFYYAVNRDLFDIKTIEDNFFTNAKTFNWWIDIKVNKSENIVKLRKLINVLTTFLLENINEAKNKSKTTYSITDFLEDL